MTDLPDLALFDVDGTLFDSERVWAEALALAMEALGERQRPERLMALIYGMAWPDAWRTLRDAFPRALEGLSVASLGRMMVERFDALFAARPPVIQPDALIAHVQQPRAQIDIRPSQPANFAAPKAALQRQQPGNAVRIAADADHVALYLVRPPRGRPRLPVPWPHYGVHGIGRDVSQPQGVAKSSTQEDVYKLRRPGLARRAQRREHVHHRRRRQVG